MSAHDERIGLAGVLQRVALAEVERATAEAGAAALALRLAVVQRRPAALVVALADAARLPAWSLRVTVAALLLSGLLVAVAPRLAPTFERVGAATPAVQPAAELDVLAEEAAAARLARRGRDRSHVWLVGFGVTAIRPSLMANVDEGTLTYRFCAGERAGAGVETVYVRVDRGGWRSWSTPDQCRLPRIDLHELPRQLAMNPEVREAWKQSGSARFDSDAWLPDRTAEEAYWGRRHDVVQRGCQLIVVESALEGGIWSPAPRTPLGSTLR